MSSNKQKSPHNKKSNKKKTINVLESESDQCGQDLRLSARDSDQSITENIIIESHVVTSKEIPKSSPITPNPVRSKTEKI